MYKKITYEGQEYYLVPVDELPKINRVAFVVGHYIHDMGAYSPYLYESEWEYWNAYAREYLVGMGDVFIHEPLGSYTKRQEAMAKLTENYDLVFELHFNASEPAAEGSEALVYKGNKTMVAVADYFCLLMDEILGYENRGAKELVAGEDGYGFLKETKGNAIILEPFFGSNEIDCMKFYKNEFAGIINKTIEFYQNI